MPEDWINIGLLRAAKNGNAKNVGSALSRGATTNVTDEVGSTPLMLSAGLGHLAVVQLLLKLGADVNSTDPSDWTPLLRAARRGYVDGMRELLEAEGETSTPSTGWAGAPCCGRRATATWIPWSS